MIIAEEINYRLLVDTAVLAGEIMLKNGGETYLVEETIEKILKTQKMKHIEASVMTTSITATMSDPDIDPITVVRRIKNRETNLSKVYLVHELVLKFCNNEINLEDTFKRLKEIIVYKPYKKWLENISLALVPPLFVIMLNGKYLDTIIALICGIVLVFITYLAKRVETNIVITNLLSTTIISILAVVSNRCFGTNIDLVIIGTIMPSVPGVAITNAAMDTLNGDYVSGIAKILEAVVKAVSIAIGVAIGIGIMNLILGGIRI